MSAVVVPLEGDARGFRRALSEARADALASGARISDALEQVGRAIGKRQGEIKLVGQEFLRFGRDAAGALGPLQGALDAVLGALRSGGPILAGVAALSAGIGLLVTKIKEARQESERLGALEKVAGISRREVDELRASLADAGVQLSRMDAAGLARVAQEAKIAKEEIVANAEAIQALATLDGITFESAAKQFFEDLAASAAKVREGISRVRDALEGV